HRWTRRGGSGGRKGDGARARTRLLDHQYCRRIIATRRAFVTHPAVRDLFQTLARDAAFQELTGKLLRREPGPFSLSGLTPTAKALYLVLLWQTTERPLVVITD